MSEQHNPCMGSIAKEMEQMLCEDEHEFSHSNLRLLRAISSDIKRNNNDCEAKYDPEQGKDHVISMLKEHCQVLSQCLKRSWDVIRMQNQKPVNEEFPKGDSQTKITREPFGLVRRFSDQQEQIDKLQRELHLEQVRRYSIVSVLEGVIQQMDTHHESMQSIYSALEVANSQLHDELEIEKQISEATMKTLRSAIESCYMDENG